MTTASIPLPAPDAGLPMSRLSPLILLGIYLIVPALALFVLIDSVATDLDFSRRISFDNELLLLIGLLLQTPHSIASILTFADPEYAVAYRRILGRCLLVGVATIALILMVGDLIFMLCLMTYNVYHQNAQQTGIAAMVARNKTRLHNVWRWMAIAIQLVGFLAILVRNSPNIHVLPTAKPIMVTAAALFLVAFGAVTILVARQSKTRMGSLLIGAHAVMLYFYVLMFALNLPLLMILAPVVVHDLTAFAFYINHNTNRNRETLHNYFSRLRHIAPLPEYLLTPLVALLLGTSMFLTGSQASLFAIFAILGNVMHIYLKGRMWRAGSPHRRYTHV